MCSSHPASNAAPASTATHGKNALLFKLIHSIANTSPCNQTRLGTKSCLPYYLIADALVPLLSGPSGSWRYPAFVQSAGGKSTGQKCGDGSKNSNATAVYPPGGFSTRTTRAARSEERRVGKECKTGG